MIIVSIMKIRLALNFYYLMLFFIGGIYEGNCGQMVNHGVTLVGFGTDNTSNKDFWKVKNSWGSTWGEEGFIRMTKTSGTGPGKCFIADQAVYPYKN